MSRISLKTSPAPSGPAGPPRPWVNLADSTPHLWPPVFLNDQRRNSPGGSGCQEREASGKSHHGQPHPRVSTGQLSPPPVLIPFRARLLKCPATSLHRLALKSSQGREELHSKGQRSHPNPSVNQEEKVACLITSSLSIYLGTGPDALQRLYLICPSTSQG